MLSMQILVSPPSASLPIKRHTTTRKQNSYRSYNPTYNTNTEATMTFIFLLLYTFYNILQKFAKVTSYVWLVSILHSICRNRWQNAYLPN